MQKNHFLTGKQYFLRKNVVFSIYNFDHFSSIFSIVEVSYFSKKWRFSLKIGSFLSKKTPFLVIHPCLNRFLALTSLKKLVWTSKHHFWEVHFWWPKWYFRWEIKGFQIWMFLSVFPPKISFWSSKMDFIKMVFRSP